MPKEEWEAAARAAAAKSVEATPISTKSPKQVSKQNSVPASSVDTPPSSLPPIKNPKPTLSAPSRSAVPPPIFSKKKYFKEEVIKDRLNKRDFSHIRHDPYYKDLTRPENEESLSFANYHRKEFWRTDVASALKVEEEKQRARQKALLATWTNEEAWRRHRATKLREMKYNAYVEMNEKMQKVGCRSNQSGAPHINIITRQVLEVDDTPIDEGPIREYLDNVSKYKTVQRKLLLQEKMSGARNFNILNWSENPPGPKLPPWPEKPPTPTQPPPPQRLITTSIPPKGHSHMLASLAHLA